MAEDREHAGPAEEKQPKPQVSPALDDGSGDKKLPFLGFTGTFTHSIDAKGRMIIPAPFRDALGARFAVAPSPDFKWVSLYPIDAWIEKRDYFVRLAEKNPKALPFLEQFSKYSYTDCESDAQGRLLLPQKIRSWRLGDAREVDVNGATTHIRVIPAADSRDQDERFDEEFADPLAMIAAMQQGKEF